MFYVCAVTHGDGLDVSRLYRATDADDFSVHTGDCISMSFLVDELMELYNESNQLQIKTEKPFDIALDSGFYPTLCHDFSPEEEGEFYSILKERYSTHNLESAKK